MSDEKAVHGWTAVPRDTAILLRDVNKIDSTALTVEHILLPGSQLAKEVMAYAKKELNEQTFNHSMRVYYYGRAIQEQHFPTWSLSPETYLLTALLHDIGTTSHNIAATLMSFEYYGGYLSLDLLRSHDAPGEQAEAVAEAVIRHQDIGESGKITALGQLIQLATIFDNTGKHKELLHEKTIENVIERFHRKGWSQCFADTIRRENGLKPWAHTTALGEDEFPEMVMANPVGGKWD